MSGTDRSVVPLPTSRKAIKPDALIVGPMKAGTSWLHEYLKTRDDVALPDGVKETFFFDQRYAAKGLDWYAAHFRNPAPSVRRILEVAPTYFHPPEVPRRVLQTLGQVDVLVTLRDPASRAFSLFHHLRRYGFTRCQNFRDAVGRHPEILQSSRYAECISRWDEAMGADHVHVLMMDDLVGNPWRFAADCCRALNLDAPKADAELPSRVNAASIPRNYHVARAGRLAGDWLRSFRLYPIVQAAKRVGLKQLFFGKPQTERSSIAPQDRSWFIDLLRDEVDPLSQRLNRDLSDWYEPADPTRHVMQRVRVG